jgi:PAS domain S-box-containing protein
MLVQSDRDGAALMPDDRYRLLIDAIKDYAIYMLDPNGRVVSWNPGAERFKGYGADEIMGEDFSRFYTEEERSSGLPETNLRRAAVEGRYEGEGWRVRKDGEKFWAHVIIDPIMDPSGELLGFAKITRDLTERKLAEEELERTRQALFQAQKLEAIGQLTGGVAHDFNNLLTVVLASLDMLLKRAPDDPQMKSLMTNALQAAQRGASLTQRMLAFARKQELRPEPVVVPDIVRGMSDILRRSIDVSIQIETRFPLSLPKVFTDANQLETALLNLVVNARDAMPAGGKITISASEEMSEGKMIDLALGRYVKLLVKDEGAGMDAETLERAIDPFFTTKGVGKGTGLGLSMVQGLMEQSGGKLILKSELDKGTTVELWLPVAEEEDRDTDSNQEPDGGIESVSASRKLCILAVDDDILVLMNTAAMLEDLGHSVVEASSGERALAALEGQRFDLVITDFAMPGMTGLQLAERIESVCPRTPVVLASGYAALPNGLETELPRLPKPFFQRDLEKILASVSTAVTEGSAGAGLAS